MPTKIDLSKLMANKYQKFNRFQQHFGLGLFVIPCLVAKLRGEFFAEDSSVTGTKDNEKILKIGIFLPLELNTFDQSQTHSNPYNYTHSEQNWTIPKVSGSLLGSVKPQNGENLF